MTLFIKDVFYKRIPRRRIIYSVTRDRYKKYLKDIMHLYQKNNELSASHYSSVSVKSLMINRLFRNHKAFSNIKSANLILNAIWFSVVDPHFSSNELHLTYKYQLLGNILDVRNMGSLVQFYCVELALKYLQKNKLDQVAVISGETVGQCYKEGAVMVCPEVNYISSLILSNSSNEKNVSIKNIMFDGSLDKILISIQKYIEVNNYINEIKIYYCDNGFVSQEKINIYLRFLSVDCVAVCNVKSSGFLPFCLNKILQEKFNKQEQYRQEVVIIDKDARAEHYAAAIVNIGCD